MKTKIESTSLTFPRRAVLLAGGAIAGLAGGITMTSSARADPGSPATPQRYVAGAGIWAPIRHDEVGDLLMRAVRRYHYEISELKEGDVTVSAQSGEQRRSAYASELHQYTAVCISPAKFPIGVAGGLWPHELEVIEAIIADADGVLGWGGNLPVPEEGLFFVAEPGDSTDVKDVGERQAIEDQIGSVGGAGSVPLDE